MPFQLLADRLLKAEREHRIAQAALTRNDPGAVEWFWTAKADLDEAHKAVEQALIWGRDLTAEA